MISYVISEPLDRAHRPLIGSEATSDTFSSIDMTEHHSFGLSAKRKEDPSWFKQVRAVFTNQRDDQSIKIYKDNTGIGDRYR